MKRLEEIKNKYAIEKEYYSWDELLSDSPEYLIEKHYDKVTELYAREVAQASLQKAAENALVQCENAFEYLKVANGFSKNGHSFKANKESITNKSNITLL